MAKVKTNPDKEIVNEIRAKLKENGGYCPCRIVRFPEMWSFSLQTLQKQFLIGSDYKLSPGSRPGSSGTFQRRIQWLPWHLPRYRSCRP